MSGIASVVLIVHILVTLAMIGVILLQRSEGGALGMGGGAGGFLSARGAGNVLTRTTTILVAVFFVTSMVLTVLGRHAAPNTLDLNGPPASSGSLGPQSAPAQAPGPDGNTQPDTGGALPPLPGFPSTTAPAGSSAPQAPETAPPTPPASAPQSAPVTPAPAPGGTPAQPAGTP